MFKRIINRAANATRSAAARVHLEFLESRRLLSNVIAIGPEFRANVSTFGFQGDESVAVDAEGNFIVAWEGLDGSGYGIYARRYNAAGVPQGSEFVVNTYTDFLQFNPAVAMDADGDFVVTWSGNGANTYAVHARRFNAAGVPQGDDFDVYSIPFQSVGSSSVAMDADGDFVVACHTYVSDGSENNVYVQRFDAAGIPQGTSFRANSFTIGWQATGAVAMDADGDFVVAWTSRYQDGSEDGVYAQRYNNTGVPQGSEFRVNTHTTNYQSIPTAAMDAAGNFVLAWTSSGQADPPQTFDRDIYAQRYNAAGVALGSEFRVNSHTTGDQAFASAAMDAAGNYLIAWATPAQDGSSSAVYAQRFTSLGIPQGGEFRINSYTTGSQQEPALAIDSDGDFVVAWESIGQDGSGYGVYAQRYAIVPEVSGSAFHFAAAPHKLSFSFDRDVSASLGTDDLLVQNLTTSQTIPSSDFTLTYDTVTHLATFTYTGSTAGIAGMLPDGNYTAKLLAAGITTIQGAPLGADHVLNFRFLQGDANNDSRVNLDDFNILAANFGQINRNFTQGDFNYDNRVNLDDFNILAARYGQVLAAADPTSSVRSGSGIGRDKWLEELLI